MNSLVRELGILAALIVAGLLWSAYGLVTRRRHRRETKVERQRVAQEHVEAQPIGGLAAHASSKGWVGPSADPPPDDGSAGYIREMARTFAGVASVLMRDEFSIGEIRYVNVFAGDIDGRHVRLGNTFTNITPSSPDYVGAGTEHPCSFVIVDLPAALPPLVVNLRSFPPYLSPLVKEWTLESEDFNRRFLVMALDRKYVSDVVTPRLMELLMARDDWAFLIEMSRLLCVCSTPFTSAGEVEERVGAVSRFAELIPTFVEHDRALAMPTLPDGTAFDPSNPASVEKVKAAFATMTPQEQKAFVAQTQKAGARFVLGAFGKDLPPQG
jgi:hypothetical protein